MNFIVMPNHMHGIIEINEAIVGTGRNLSTHDPGNEHRRQPAPETMIAIEQAAACPYKNEQQHFGNTSTFMAILKIEK